MNRTYSIEHFSWTVALHRSDGSVDFNQNWDSYEAGFGSPNGEYWLGNEYLHYLTNAKSYKLRFDLEDWDGNTAYAEYSSFRVTSEADKYRLLLGDYSGTARANSGADRSRGLLFHNNSRFSTYDQDNDDWVTNSCLGYYSTNGFWFAACGWVYPTSAYCPTASCGSSAQRLVWEAWRVYDYSLKRIKMMIRPVDYN